MLYLLDTNVCVDFLTGRYPALSTRLLEIAASDVCTSSVVVAELRYGAEKSARTRDNHQRIDTFLGDVSCYDFDPAAALRSGALRRILELRGEIIGPNDLLVAAHAISLGAILVTDNVREFQRLDGLRIENWRSA